MDKGLLSKNYIFTVLTAVCFYISAFMLNAVCGQYCTDMGADKTVSGIVTCAFTLSSFFTRPIWGYITDKKGRKLSFYSGGFLCTVSSVLMFFTAGVWMLFLSRIIFGTGYSALTTAGGTMVCDTVPEESLGKAISFYGITNVLSQAVAPAAALWLYSMDFRWVAAATAVLSALAVTGGLFIQYNEKEYVNPRQKFRIYEKTALPAAYTIVFFAFATASVYSFVPLMAEEREISHVGLFFAVSAAGLLMSRIFNAKFCEKLGKTKVFYIGDILFVIGFITLAFSYSIRFLLISAAVYGVGAGFIHPVVNTAAVSDCKSEDRGLATGTFMMSQDLGMTAGAVRWGTVSEKMGFMAVYLSVAAVGIAMGIVFRKRLYKKVENS